MPQGFKRNIDEFVGSLRKLYSDDLVCVILYGSAASSELTEVHSNINLLVVLKKDGSAFAGSFPPAGQPTF